MNPIRIERHVFCLCRPIQLGAMQPEDSESKEPNRVCIKELFRNKEKGWGETESICHEDQPRMMDEDECAAVRQMIGRGNRSSREPAPEPLCPPKIPHDPIWPRTWAATMESLRLAT
jgi:hypothetical protein